MSSPEKEKWIKMRVICPNCGQTHKVAMFRYDQLNVLGHESGRWWLDPVKFQEYKDDVKNHRPRRRGLLKCKKCNIRFEWRFGLEPPAVLTREVNGKKEKYLQHPRYYTFEIKAFLGPGDVESLKEHNEKFPLSNRPKKPSTNK